MMLSFWNEALQNLSQDQRKDKFAFIVNTVRYEIPFSFALVLSPFLFEEYLKDPSFKELEIIDEEMKQEEFSNFLEGKAIRKETFMKIGKILKNQQMIKIWKNSKELTKERVIESIKSIYNIYQYYNNNGQYGIIKNVIEYDDIAEEIDFIRKNFEDMKEEIKEFRLEELVYILTKGEISIESEDTMWDIIKERIQDLKRKSNNIMKNNKNETLRRILLGSIQIKNLNQKNFQEYIEEIEAEDVIPNQKEESYIWNQIQEILINQTIITENIEKSDSIEHKDGNNFDGIIMYLEKKFGNDIHQQGIICITASSNNSHNKPEQVIDYNWHDVTGWYSNPKNPGEWWQINFKTMKVKMSGYSLKTFSGRKGSYHLKNWVIEGRNDEEEWEEIDRQDNDDLNGSFKQKYYSLQEKTKPYQYFRIKTLGKDHYGLTHYLSLLNVEIYGELKHSF
jgi:hypothetical protein